MTTKNHCVDSDRLTNHRLEVIDAEIAYRMTWCSPQQRQSLEARIRNQVLADVSLMQTARNEADQHVRLAIPEDSDCYFRAEETMPDDGIDGFGG